jgi:purine-nucleoside phosphorylase
MTETAVIKSVQEIVFDLRKKVSSIPEYAVVLGSGVNVLEGLDEEVSYSYLDIFGISPGVIGHSGSLSIGMVAGKQVAVLRGRFHLYEGHNWDVVTLPARVLVEWGVPNLILTNAAGGINPDFNVGDLMLLSGYRDHLNPQWQQKGLLPAVMAPIKSIENKLSEQIWASAQRLNQEDKNYRALQRGTYAGLLGPCYETIAEIEMLKDIGADAVGMSTVPELETANGVSTHASAISVITNIWKKDTQIEGHEEVLREAKAASVRLDTLFRAIIAQG